MRGFGKTFCISAKDCSISAKQCTSYNWTMFRLMCVTAHPDDEAGGFGGSLRLYRDHGVETSVVCLTPGQAGSHRGKAKSDAELADMRRREFMDSCQILGISRPVVLDYPDGQLYRQELNRVVYELTLEIRRFRPHVMLTFGPEGGVTGHPDHSMSGIFAGLAFHWAGRANRYADQLTDGVAPHRTAKLYYTAAGIPIPGRPPITFAPQSASIDIGDHLETKIAAFKAHKTQQPLWAIFEENVRKGGRVENFHLAASILTGPTESETDLFSRIAES